MIHDLKIWPEYFRDVCSGAKTYEIRLNDRDYKVGDTLVLRDYSPNPPLYSGDYVLASVRHVMSDSPFVREGYVVLGISIYYGYVAIGDISIAISKDGMFDAGILSVDCPICEAKDSIIGELQYEPDQMYCSSTIHEAECGCNVQEHSIYSQAVARMQERHYQLKKQYAERSGV
jgi:hypothetical protein